MATNGLKSSPSILETLPPKKRSSRENPNEPPSEHVFKTPSPFWNQNGFKRLRRSREAAVSLIGPHLAQAYHPQWPDMASITSPTLSRALADNGATPSWGQHLASTDHLMSLQSSDSSNPINLHNLYGSPYYWSYMPEPRDVFNKSYHRRLRGQYGPPIIRPVPQSFSCHYSRALLSKDGLGGEEEARQWFENERVTQWHERLQNQRVLQDWRARKSDFMRDSLKWDSMQLTELGAELSRHKHYSEFKDLSQDSRPEDLHHQQLPVTHPSCSNTEQLKWSTEEQAREQHHLLVRSEGAEGQKQLLSRFVEGSLIELVGGKLKRVEDLKMEDFEICSESCPELSLRRFTVQKITRSATPGLMCLEVELEGELHCKLCLEVCEEYPFFVCGRGWSSCSPGRTAHLCCLRCHQLHLGDVCLALTPVPAPPATPTQSVTDKGNGGHLEQVNNTENTGEAAKVEKQRKRHHSAPELRNILQYEMKS